MQVAEDVKKYLLSRGLELLEEKPVRKVMILLKL